MSRLPSRGVVASTGAGLAVVGGVAGLLVLANAHGDKTPYTTNPTSTIQSIVDQTAIPGDGVVGVAGWKVDESGRRYSVLIVGIGKVPFKFQDPSNSVRLQCNNGLPTTMTLKYREFPGGDGKDFDGWLLQSSPLAVPPGQELTGRIHIEGTTPVSSVDLDLNSLTTQAAVSINNTLDTPNLSC